MHHCDCGWLVNKQTYNAVIANILANQLRWTAFQISFHTPYEANFLWTDKCICLVLQPRLWLSTVSMLLWAWTKYGTQEGIKHSWVMAALRLHEHGLLLNVSDPICSMLQRNVKIVPRPTDYRPCKGPIVRLGPAQVLDVSITRWRSH